MPRCSRPAPSWYLSESRSCSTKPCACSVCSSPWTVGARHPELVGELARRRAAAGPQASAFRIRAARSTDWIVPRRRRALRSFAFGIVESASILLRIVAGARGRHRHRLAQPRHRRRDRRARRARWPATEVAIEAAGGAPTAAWAPTARACEARSQRADQGDGVDRARRPGQRDPDRPPRARAATRRNGPVRLATRRSSRARSPPPSSRRPGRPLDEVASAAEEARASPSSERLVSLPDGVDLHARPAAQFVRTAMGFDARIAVAAGDREADAKSLLAVLALGAKAGTRYASGPTATTRPSPLDDARRLRRRPRSRSCRRAERRGVRLVDGRAAPPRCAARLVASQRADPRRGPRRRARRRRSARRRPRPTSSGTEAGSDAASPQTSTRSRARRRRRATVAAIAAQHARDGARRAAPRPKRSLPSTACGRGRSCRC